MLKRDVFLGCCVSGPGCSAVVRGLAKRARGGMREYPESFIPQAALPPRCSMREVKKASSFSSPSKTVNVYGLRGRSQSKNMGQRYSEKNGRFPKRLKVHSLTRKEMRGHAWLRL